MKFPMLSNTECITGLALADGNVWTIIAVDCRAQGVVSALAKAMQLQSPDKSYKTPSEYSSCRYLFVQVKDRIRNSSALLATSHLKAKEQGTICTLYSYENIDNSRFHLMHLSMVIMQGAQCRGGVLLHGALAEWNGKGVILAGPGGRGKSTAIRRLPFHWDSFCDDTTLVVCDNKGVYWAHPWPTWSTFMFNGPGGKWDVQHAVPLKGIFFLEHAHEDAFKPLGTAQRVCLLNASAEQTSWLMPGHSKKNTRRRIRLQRFDNICYLAQAIPSYILRICPNGAFWEQIERAISG